MTGFFKKLGDAVKEIEKIAKEFDVNKDSRARVRPTERASATDETEPSEGRDIRQYLSMADLVRMTQLSFDQYTPYRDETWEGGTYTCSDSQVHTHLDFYFARWGPEGYDAENAMNFWNYLLEIMPDAQPLPGLGEAAYWSGNNSAVARQGHEILQAGGGLSREIMHHVLQHVINQL